MSNATDFWVFGYGSLMWRPGFAYEERAEARLEGCHRALCMRSVRHRGTRERPGLVMGLAPGGACRGIAYRVAPDRAEAVRAYLYDREMTHYRYFERHVDVKLGDGRMLPALTYVADTDHSDFERHLSEAEVARRIRAAAGESGSNLDYVENVARHLKELGIDDTRLARVLELAKVEAA